MINKFFLSVDEAVKYFGIGRNRFRDFLSNHKDEDFVFMNGNKMLIKREMLEDYFRREKKL